MTQAEAILNFLKAGNKITPLEALERFGSLRLGAVIFELKKSGFVIESRMVETNTGKHVKEYWMPAKKESLPPVSLPASHATKQAQAFLFSFKKNQHNEYIP